MALGALATPGGNVGFDAEGTAMVPISSGGSTLGEIKIKSPLENVKDTFADMRDSLASMVGIQTREEKRQAAIDEKLLAQKDFEIEMMNKKFADEGMQGAPMPMSNDDLEGVDTDDKTYGNFVEKAETAGTGILDSIKDAFDQTSFGEKMMAVILAGGFLLFSKYSDTIQKYLEPVVQFVMDIIELIGPQGAFFAFLGGFVLLKSGLAKKGLMKAGGLILKTIKASAASLDRQGGLFKAMGNGFERINKGVGSLVGGLKKTGSFITTNLTKGFNKLGTGIEAMNKGVVKAAGAIKGGFSKLLGLIGKGFMMMKVGMTSMLSSLGPMLAPLLPIIAIVAGIAAVLYSLKSGFDVFKTSLDEGDSMFTAVLKGLGDAMLTLVTLPYVLIQKLVGFIAGLFGFDNFKEKLESFDIKEQIVKALGSLVGGLVKVLKGVAKGAAAALAAVFTFKNPVEAFSKAYAAVMKGGEASIEGTSDFQGDQSQAEFNREEATFDRGAEAAMYDYESGNETGDASAAESFYAKQREEEKYDQAYLDKLPKRMSKSSKEMYLKIHKNDMKNLQKAEAQAEVIKNADGSTSKTASTSGTYVIKGGQIQGDTINQMSETNIAGDLQVNNTEMTQKILQDHSTF